MNKRIDEIM